MKKLLFLTLLFGLMFTSCQKENAKEGSEINTSSLITKDEGRAIFAKALAKSIAVNPELKQFLITEAQKKFNGDYEILYAMKRHVLIGNKTIATILFENYKKDNGLSARTDEQVLLDYFEDGILANDPYLTIFIPHVHFDFPELLDLDTKVGYFSEANFDEEVDETILMVNADGLVSDLSVDAYPEGTSIFIVKQNENTVFIRSDDKVTTINGNNINDVMGIGGQTNTGPDPCQIWLDLIDNLELESTVILNDSYEQVTYSQYYSAYLECSGSVGTGGGGPCNDDCHRECWSDKDQIRNVKFVSYNDLKGVESWIKGNVELKAIVLWGENYSSTSNSATARKLEKFGTFEREDFFEDCNWFNGNCSDPIYIDLGWETFTWDIHDGDSEDKTITWLEIDEIDFSVNSTVSYQVKFGSSSLSLSVGVKVNPNKDKGLGESLVEWCDDAIMPGHEYFPGRVDFYYNRRNYEE